MSPVRPFAVMVVALLPSVLLAWFLTDPARNQPILIRLEHFVITSNVSIVAALVAFLVARAALDVGHFRDASHRAGIRMHGRDIRRPWPLDARRARAARARPARGPGGG